MPKRRMVDALNPISSASKIRPAATRVVEIESVHIGWWRSLFTSSTMRAATYAFPIKVPSATAVAKFTPWV